MPNLFMYNVMVPRFNFTDILFRKRKICDQSIDIKRIRSCFSNKYL